MLVVTGGAGFVGSNLIEALNQSGREKILLVDDLTDASKIANLADLIISDYADKDEFLSDIERRGIPESARGRGFLSSTPHRHRFTGERGLFVSPGKVSGH